MLVVVAYGYSPRHSVLFSAICELAQRPVVVCRQARRPSLETRRGELSRLLCGVCDSAFRPIVSVSVCVSCSLRFSDGNGAGVRRLPSPKTQLLLVSFDHVDWPSVSQKITACTLLLSEIRSRNSCAHRALRSPRPRPANTGEPHIIIITIS